jgi:hypothetical protein
MQSMVFDEMSLLNQNAPYAGQVKSNAPKDNDFWLSLLEIIQGISKATSTRPQR